VSESEPSPHVPAATRAYEYTKRLIIRGDLDGAVSELAVAEALSISRTPVHEAFLRLEAEALLSLESRKGAMVRPISPGEASDVLQMREAIESTAAAKVIAEGYTTELLPVLDSLLTRQREALRDKDIDAFVDTDDELHSAVITASRNAIAVHFARLLRDRQQRLRHQLMRVNPTQLAPAHDQHRALARALSDLDAERYRILLAEHIAMHRVAL
jgi:DNA-binding GntR family transcriptional regulator